MSSETLIPTVVNVRKDKFDIYIGRPTKWGKPYIIEQDGTREEVIQKYEEYLKHSILLIDLKELYGKRLGCFCHPLPCHGDVLVKFVTRLLNS